MMPPKRRAARHQTERLRGAPSPRWTIRSVLAVGATIALAATPLWTLLHREKLAERTAIVAYALLILSVVVSVMSSSTRGAEKSMTGVPREIAARPRARDSA